VPVTVTGSPCGQASVETREASGDKSPLPARTRSAQTDDDDGRQRGQIGRRTGTKPPQEHIAVQSTHGTTG